MKKLLKIIALTMAFATIFSVSAFAGGDQPNLPDAEVQQEEVKPAVEQEEAVQPRGVPCVYCDVGNMVQTESVSTSWRTVDYIPCQCEGGYAPMQDAVQERTVTIVMTCGSCGRSDDDTSIQTRIKHLG